MRGVIIGVVALLALLTAPAADAQNPWLGRGMMNIAHQGGDREAPSNTMYAYKRALRVGADMLELDVHSTADGELVALHDSAVDRTTDGTGSVYEMSLSEVQALDAGYWFVPGRGYPHDLPAEAYPLRGVRTGQRSPPPGYAPEDFRIPTLDEVLRAFPGVPVNIEIKGQSDTDVGSFLANAERLATYLNGIGRADGIIVASFNDLAIERFHQLAPDVGIAPATAAVALFTAARLPPRPGSVAFQVPITQSGIPVANESFVADAHAQGYAVHVWLSNDPENEATYSQLLDWGVDGIMAAEPARLEAFLCGRGAGRPEPLPGHSRCPATGAAGPVSAGGGAAANRTAGRRKCDKHKRRIGAKCKPRRCTQRKAGRGRCKRGKRKRESQRMPGKGALVVGG